VFIKKPQAVIGRRHVNNRAHAKTYQNPAFHPGIGPPSPIGVAFRRADLTAIQ
jgi:hypothetical protein